MNYFLGFGLAAFFFFAAGFFVAFFLVAGFFFAFSFVFLFFEGTVLPRRLLGIPRRTSPARVASWTQASWCLGLSLQKFSQKASESKLPAGKGAQAPRY